MDLGGMEKEEVEVQQAYEVVKRIDVLNVSGEGMEGRFSAENAYNEYVSRVENRIIARLRDKPGTEECERVRYTLRVEVILIRKCPILRVQTVAGTRHGRSLDKENSRSLEHDFER